MGTLEIQWDLETHRILLASAAEQQSPLPAGCCLDDGGGWCWGIPGWHWGTPRLEGIDPLLKAGGLVRQVVGIGGGKVDKTYYHYS